MSHSVNNIFPKDLLLNGFNMIVNGLNPRLLEVHIVWLSGWGSSDQKNCCWWLMFKQAEWKSSSESSQFLVNGVITLLSLPFMILTSCCVILLVTHHEVCSLFAWQLISWSDPCHRYKRLEKHSNPVINCVCYFGIWINPGNNQISNKIKLWLWN